MKWGLHLEIDPVWSRQMIAAHASGTRVLPGPGEDVNLLEDAGVVNEEAITEGAISLDITPPMDDTSDGDDAPSLEGLGDEHWTPQVEACTTVAQVEDLLKQMGGIEPLPRRANTQRLAYLRIVQLLTPHIASARSEGLAMIRQKLEALPIEMPAVSQAIDMVQGREEAFANAAVAGVIDGQARRLPVGAGA